MYVFVHPKKLSHKYYKLFHSDMLKKISYLLLVINFSLDKNESYCCRH